MINFQEHVFPSDYIKLRYIENHDTPRASHLFPDTDQMLNWLAFAYFQKGTTMLYGGQEWQNEEYCTLFDKAVFDRDPQKDVSPMITRLGVIKKTLLPVDADFSAAADDDSGIVTAFLTGKSTRMAGVFSLERKSGEVSLNVPDGKYVNEISGETISVTDGKLTSKGKPMIFKVR